MIETSESYVSGYTENKGGYALQSASDMRQVFTVKSFAPVVVEKPGDSDRPSTFFISSSRTKLRLDKDDEDLLPGGNFEDIIVEVPYDAVKALCEISRETGKIIGMSEEDQKRYTRLHG